MTSHFQLSKLNLYLPLAAIPLAILEVFVLPFDFWQERAIFNILANYIFLNPIHTVGSSYLFMTQPQTRGWIKDFNQTYRVRFEIRLLLLALSLFFIFGFLSEVVSPKGIFGLSTAPLAFIFIALASSEHRVMQSYGIFRYTQGQTTAEKVSSQSKWLWIGVALAGGIGESLLVINPLFSKSIIGVMVSASVLLTLMILLKQKNHQDRVFVSRLFIYALIPFSTLSLFISRGSHYLEFNELFYRRYGKQIRYFESKSSQILFIGLVLAISILLLFQVQAGVLGYIDEGVLYHPVVGVMMILTQVGIFTHVYLDSWLFKNIGDKESFFMRSPQ